VLFLVPLAWWADRGCAYVGVDPLYHATIWMHERLGVFVIVLAAMSVLSVLIKIVLARRRLAQLLRLAEPLPPRIRHAFETAAAEMNVPLPRLAYLDVLEHVATTVIGPVVLLSRGLADRLDDNELELVARHELVHVDRRDAGAGVLWHLAFVALLLPGFEPLERRLHATRERRANMLAADGREDAYLAVLTRLARGAALCEGGDIGLGARAQRRGDRWLVWIAPALIVTLAVALPLSHAEFMHDLPFLLKHHC
jgi:Zn-dependent protease with chaperone function